MHKCPQQPCEDCWDEARGVGLILVIVGIAICLFMAGCVSWRTSDCRRDDGGMWVCHDKEIRNR